MSAQRKQSASSREIGGNQLSRLVFFFGKSASSLPVYRPLGAGTLSVPEKREVNEEWRLDLRVQTSRLSPRHIRL